MKIDFKNIIDKKNYIWEFKSVPLRIWTKDWPIPSKAKLKRYTVNLKTSHKTNAEVSRYALWGLIEDAKKFNKRTYKKHRTKQWGKGKKSGRRFDYKILSDEVWIKLLSKSYLFNESGRRFHFDGNYLRLSLYKDEMAIWYLSGEGQVRFVIFPRFARVDDKFFELIGFLDGEMSKKISKTGGSALKISNAEPIIIREIIKRFNKYFNIHKNSWTASLVLNNKLNQFHEIADNELKDFWAKNVGLPKNRFTKTTLQKKYKSLFSNNGIIQIRYSNTLFFRILLDILKNTRKIIIQDKESCAAYIRGVAAGEGGIGKRGDKLRIVHIGSMDEENKIFYSKCLEKININSIQNYKLRIEVCGLRNFIILRDINIFKYIPYRKEKFIKALKNLERDYKQRTSQS